MGARLPDRIRGAVLADVRAGRARNAIARDHGIAAGSVTNIARAAGLQAGDRSQTAAATAANAIDHAAVLVRLAARAAGIAGAILTSFETMGADDWSAVSPHTRAIALGICSDKARELAPADDEAQREAAVSLLGAVFTGLQAKHSGDAA